jgi:hypothetical protein
VIEDLVANIARWRSLEVSVLVCYPWASGTRSCEVSQTLYQLAKSDERRQISLRKPQKDELDFIGRFSSRNVGTSDKCF